MKAFRELTPAADATEEQRALADNAAEVALATGSMIRDAPKRYTRAFGERPGAEPSQDNTDMQLVLDTLKLIGRGVEQIEITKGHQAILINDDGNRATVQIDIEDVSPASFRPKLERALAAIPERFKPAEVAQAMQQQLLKGAERMADQLQAEENRAAGISTEPPRVPIINPPSGIIKGKRIERGGLE